MRLLVACRTAWLVTTLLALTTASVARSATPSSPSLSTSKPAASTPRDPDAVLQQALDLERQRNWQAAIDLYQDAQEQWPSRSEFSHRRRLCETHYKIVKRYQDQSFRKVLLRLPRDRALALHDELLEKIETQYVDPVALEPLVRRGLRQPGGRAARPRVPRHQREPERPGTGRLAPRGPEAASCPPRGRRPGRGAGRGDRRVRAGGKGPRHGSGPGHPRVRLRCLRRPGRLHQLLDPRQARRPLCDDRRQFRRAGDRAEARRRGAAARRRDPGRPRLGGRAQGARPDHPRRRQPGARAEPRRGRWPAPGERGDSRRDHRRPSRRQDAGLSVEPTTRRGRERRAGEDRRPRPRRRLHPAHRLPEDLRRGTRQGDRDAPPARDAARWCSTSGGTPAAC